MCECLGVWEGRPAPGRLEETETLRSTSVVWAHQGEPTSKESHLQYLGWETTKKKVTCDMYPVVPTYVADAASRPGDVPFPSASHLIRKGPAGCQGDLVAAAAAGGPDAASGQRGGEGGGSRMDGAESLPCQWMPMMRCCPVWLLSCCFRPASCFLLAFLG